MKRLTKCKPNNESMFPYRLKDEELSTELYSINKLGRLEDIEEDLGIDLIEYFKIKNAKIIYVKESDGNISEMLVRPSENSIDVYHKGFAGISECDKTLYFKDYGITWAKTKEELEK